MQTNLGINGFGRIGRLATRLAVERPERFALKAINASGSLEFLKYNLLHDSYVACFPPISASVAACGALRCAAPLPCGSLILIPFSSPQRSRVGAVPARD
jgi:hypothetical protein